MLSKTSFLACSALLLALPVGVLLPGCGGGGSSGTSNNNNSRTFNSALNLAPGQIAQVVLDVQSGLATGRLVVPQKSAQSQKTAQAFSFVVPPGAYSFFGSFTEPNNFSAGGKIPGIGNFTIVGQIPGNPGGGTYTISAKGETATGSFVTATATPTATATATATRTPTATATSAAP